MHTIYKYQLRLTDVQEIWMPQGANILSVGIDPTDSLALWAAVDTELDDTPRTIRIIGTGHPVSDLGRLHFIGTVVEAPFVWHIFEQL